VCIDGRPDPAPADDVAERTARVDYLRGFLASGERLPGAGHEAATTVVERARVALDTQRIGRVEVDQRAAAGDIAEVIATRVGGDLVAERVVVVQGLDRLIGAVAFLQVFAGEQAAGTPYASMIDLTPRPVLSQRKPWVPTKSTLN